MLALVEQHATLPLALSVQLRMDHKKVRLQESMIDQQLFPGSGANKASVQLSIVVQGPFKHATDPMGHSTLAVLRSARQHYPDAELIYSGWDDAVLPAELHGLADLVVLSRDPGPVHTFETATGPVVENINRQIVSTVAGLKLASGRFAMKLRSDTLIVSNGLQLWTERQRAKLKKAILFELPVVTASQYTRLFFFEYGGFRSCVGHLSDLFFFGLKDDLLRYWDGPLATPHAMNLRDRYAAATVEQILAIRFLVECGVLPPNACIENKFAKKVCDLSWARWAEILEENFVVLDDGQLGVERPSRFTRLDLSRFIFESDSSISASRGTGGYRQFLWFYLLKIVIYSEYQLKFLARQLLGVRRYKSLTKRVYGTRLRS